MKNLIIIEHLVFKLGGGTGAVRRLVYRWRGAFSVTLIKAALARRYPLLVPAPFQVEDAFAQMELSKQIRHAFTRLEKFFTLNRRAAI